MLCKASEFSMPLTKRPKMTPKKIAANRANAKKSTGPCTAAGKQHTRFNALTHGATARELKATMPLMGEDPAQYDRLREGFLASLPPANFLESYLLENMAETAWRQERLIRNQYAMQAYAVQKYTRDEGDPVERDRNLSVSVHWALSMRLEGQLSRHFERQFKMLMRLRAARADESDESNVENSARHGRPGVEEYEPLQEVRQDIAVAGETVPVESPDAILAEESDGSEANGGDQSPAPENAPAEPAAFTPLDTTEENSLNRTHDTAENKRQEMLAEWLTRMGENLKAAREADRDALNTGTESSSNR